ncbi:MAG: hypothetical protein IKW30_01750 [Lachnospiraceae bacterium]|nr:hypothetical protein [Lachnospiraceae bacterium]
MKNKLSACLIIASIVLCLCACTKTENTEAITDEITTEELTPAELPTDSKEELINVNLEDVTITPQENWKLIEYDEANQRVKYEIEIDGIAHEITLYTITDVKIDGKEIDINDASFLAHDLPVYLGYEEMNMAQLSCNDLNSEYIFSSILYENDTKQTCCIIGDNRTLILECEPFVVLDEITENILFSYERSNPDLKTGFYSAQSCKDLPYLELSIRIRTDSEVCNNTEPETMNVPSTSGATKKEDIVPDTSEYKYYQMGDPMLDFSNPTIVTDNDPDFVIIKNGPGPIIKSSYPYIKTYYGHSGPYTAQIMGEYITLTIRSTDYYGCPYEVTINGVDYTFKTRRYDYTNPDRDSSGWHCWLEDYDSPDCYIQIYGDVDCIDMKGSLIYAYFYPAEFYDDPALLEQYPRNN